MQCAGYGLPRNHLLRRWVNRDRVDVGFPPTYAPHHKGGLGRWAQEVGESPARSRHCDQGANPQERSHSSSRGGGRLGRAKIWKSGYWSTALLQSNRGEDPERR
jgi:hypothetical protein